MSHKKSFLSAEEVMNEVEISKASAYRLIKKFNSELEVQGFITFSGKVSRKYFETRVYM